MTPFYFTWLIFFKETIMIIYHQLVAIALGILNLDTFNCSFFHEHCNSSACTRILIRRSAVSEASSVSHRLFQEPKLNGDSLWNNHTQLIIRTFKQFKKFYLHWRDIDWSICIISSRNANYATNAWYNKYWFLTFVCNYFLF